MIEYIQGAVGAVSIIFGGLCFSVWADTKESLFGLLGIILLLGGLTLFFTLPKIETEKPAYSFEWIDEETKCHFYGGKLINCETVRYAGEI